MITNNKKLIIFDLDGTLIDSVPDLALAVNSMLKEVNRSEFPENTIRQWVGNGAQTLVKRALSASAQTDKNLDEELFENALAIFLNIYSKNLCIATKTYPNVNETLQTLKSRGYTLAIVTNKPFDFVEPILKGLNLDGLFEHILGGDSLKEKKPSPLPLQHICEKFSINIEDTLMVGDSKNDILAANACSMHSVGVTYVYNYGEDISTYNPSKVIDNFMELLEIL